MLYAKELFIQPAAPEIGGQKRKTLKAPKLS